MRLWSNLVLAALAAVGVPLAGNAQITAPAKAPAPALAGCDWQPIGQFSNLVPRALVAKGGNVLLAADDVSNSSRSVAVILRRPAGGGSWETVDRYLPADAAQTGARALHVDADGNAYALMWEQRTGNSLLVLRRSFGDGAAGTWEGAETSWTLSAGGALASDPDGRLYVAHGYAGAGGIGWRVESALRGIGAFSVEDDFRVTGVFDVIPFDFERTPDGTLLVAGQLDGAPDEWVVRSRPMPRDGNTALWRTLDRFRLTANAYGLVPRGIAVNDDGRLMVAGLGVRGGGADDYEWVERWQNARGRWRTVTYQLADGLTSVAQDAASTRDGVAVLGVGYTPQGGELRLRESTDSGAHWETVLAVAGVTDLWSARLAVDGTRAAVAAALQGSAVVLGCRL